MSKARYRCDGLLAAAGPHSKYSVLDKIVPAYYHRLEADGGICGSAFGANNAPEHAMMERLVIDDLLHWAVQYKVRGCHVDAFVGWGMLLLAPSLFFYRVHETDEVLDWRSSAVRTTPLRKGKRCVDLPQADGFRLTS